MKKSFGDRKPWKKSFGSDRDGGRATLHTTTCSKCGESTTVPFKPNGKKPVFCNSCFKKEGGGLRLEGANARGASNDDSPKEQFKIMNNKLDEIIRLLSGTSFHEEKKKPRSPSSPKKYR